MAKKLSTKVERCPHCGKLKSKEKSCKYCDNNAVAETCETITLKLSGHDMNKYHRVVINGVAFVRG